MSYNTFNHSLWEVQTKPWKAKRSLYKLDKRKEKEFRKFPRVIPWNIKKHRQVSHFKLCIGMKIRIQVYRERVKG